MRQSDQKTILGILAHVDAGKTTLAEAILFESGSIKKRGRVDHADAYLDTFAMEKERGITIFSKMAQLSLAGRAVTLLDTPGHADFSAETERTLQVLDAAVLVISAPDGVQPHDMTLWRLLERWQIPVFLFVNKMDQPGTGREKVLGLLRKSFGQGVTPFDQCHPEEGSGSGGKLLEWMEEAALCDEQLLEQYMTNLVISWEDCRNAVSRRTMFPCFFGSALKQEGIGVFLEAMSSLLPWKSYPETFGARVYKIARDSQGHRLTYLKVTGGVLRPRQVVEGSFGGRQEQGDTEPEDLSAADPGEDAGRNCWQEKADRLLEVSGETVTPIQEAKAGTICAVLGLEHTYAGGGLGFEREDTETVLESVLSYALEFPPECDPHHTLRLLSQLEEEVPEMHLRWDEEHQQILVQVMGNVQIEILQRLILERFGLKCHFGEGRIRYKETITQTVEGVGHFEPLRHYAEVHLLMEPGERGSGLVFSSSVSTDDLSLNWQRLILTHLEEKQHRGVLTGSAITDMKITLAAGRAHPKHTEGGDFRQATYRAVRQGLMQAASTAVLLEPFYSFRLELPFSLIGRAMTDIQLMGGTVQVSESSDQDSVLTGKAPVRKMNHYQADVAAYSSGRGHLYCTVSGYEPCADQEEIVAAIGYDALSDTRNTPDSVFCSHGAGMVVPWEEVPRYMHLPPVLETRQALKTWQSENETGKSTAAMPYKAIPADIGDDDELMNIFYRTFGQVKQKRAGWKKARREFGTGAGDSASAGGKRPGKKEEPKDQYLLVDGYNIIFAWEELRSLAEKNIDSARSKLLDILANYQGYRQMTVIVVFDAYKVENGVGSAMKYHNIYVVYTKEAETADSYIERAVHTMNRQYDVTVATSDAAEQIIIWAAGAMRLSAADLKEDIRAACREMQDHFLGVHPSGKAYLFENLSEDMAAFLEDVRLGLKKLDE